MRLSPTRVAPLLICVAFLAVVLGCGRGGPEMIQVTGTITLDGNPVPEAAVMFAGPEGGTPVTAITDGKGEFSLKAAAGANAVGVSKTGQGGGAAKPTSADNMLMPAGRAGAAPVQHVIPLKYADPRKSELKVDVKRGMAPVELKLSSK